MSPFLYFFNLLGDGNNGQQFKILSSINLLAKQACEINALWLFYKPEEVLFKIFDQMGVCSTVPVLTRSCLLVILLLWFTCPRRIEALFSWRG